MRKTTVTLIAATSLFALGCPGTHTIHGRVVRAPGLEPSLMVETVAEARVTVQCPEGVRDRYSGYTEANGTFRVFGNGLIDGACTLTIEKRGYRARRYQIAEICATPYGSRCRVAVIQAELTPLATAWR